MELLYHGSDHIIVEPQYGVGNPRNDYGLGFYCTPHREMAMEWAVGLGCSGFANQYQADFSGLNIVDLGSVDYCTLHWLAVLLEHRTFDLRSPLAVEARQYLTEHFHVDVDSADVVRGYRADDSYFTFAQDFISGVICYRQLEHAMRLGKLGQQTAVISSRAFQRLEFLRAFEAPKEFWLPKREERDRTARRQYLDVERNKRRSGDLFIMQIIDEGMVSGDARL